MKTMMMNIIWRDEDYLFANKSRTYRDMRWERSEALQLERIKRPIWVHKKCATYNKVFMMRNFIFLCAMPLTIDMHAMLICTVQHWKIHMHFMVEIWRMKCPKGKCFFFSFHRFAVLGARFTVAISKPINKKQRAKPYDEVVWFRESLLRFGMGNKCRQICLWEIHTGSRVGANISLASISPAGEAKNSRKRWIFNVM